MHAHHHATIVCSSCLYSRMVAVFVQTIVFCNTKQTAHRLTILLGLAGLSCGELHGNLTQRQRLETLDAFRHARIKFVVATDLAGRGLDIRVSVQGSGGVCCGVPHVCELAPQLSLTLSYLYTSCRFRASPRSLTLKCRVTRRPTSIELAAQLVQDVQAVL